MSEVFLVSHAGARPRFASSTRRAPQGAAWRARERDRRSVPDILADLHERGGLGELVRRVPRHVTRVLRHRA